MDAKIPATAEPGGDFDEWLALEGAYSAARIRMPGLMVELSVMERMYLPLAAAGLAF
jgi:hypothetical protein